eukprot:521875_1
MYDGGHSPYATVFVDSNDEQGIVSMHQGIRDFVDGDSDLHLCGAPVRQNDFVLDSWIPIPTANPAASSTSSTRVGTPSPTTSTTRVRTPSPTNSTTSTTRNPSTASIQRRLQHYHRSLKQ